jgi:ketosteroid isomerase-like protein
MDAHEAAAQFAQVWEAGWNAHDVDAVTARYAEDCVHRSTPFRPVHRGRAGMAEYVRQAFAEERDPEVRFNRRPLVEGDRALVEYWALVTDAETGQPQTLAGCAVVRFGPDALVVESRDYWHLEDGHHPPPEDW